MHGVIGAGVILSVMGGGVFTNVLAAPNAWPTEVLAPLFVCAGTEWLVPKSPVAFHSLGLLRWGRSIIPNALGIGLVYSLPLFPKEGFGHDAPNRRRH